MRRSISIIIPAYNEEKRLPVHAAAGDATIWTAASWDFAEIVVVDDGSRDGTVGGGAQRPALRVLQNPGNRGKGYSVRHGMLEAKGDWALFTDADLSAPIEELDKLWSRAEQEQARRWPSGRARSTGRWSACTSRCSAKSWAGSSTW